MRTLLKIISCPLFFVSVSTQAQHVAVYDSTMAQRLNADGNGMRKVVMVILKTASGDTIKGWRRDSLFAGHMRNIQKMADDGKLFVAGPLTKNDYSFRGIYVLNTANIDEAKKLCFNDPAVRSGIFTPEFFEWYVTAAIGEIPAIHKKLIKPKKS